MAFKHPSFLEIVADAGIPFFYNAFLHPPLDSFEALRVVVVKHRPSDFDYPVNATLGSPGICNVWGRFVFPSRSSYPHGTYIRIPRLDRAVMRQFEDKCIQELARRGTVKKHIIANGDRIIDLEGLT